MTDSNQQRDYSDRGICTEHKSLLEPVVDWLFNHGAHRVDVTPIHCSCSPDLHYRIDAYAEEKEKFPILANIDLDAVNNETREFRKERVNKVLYGEERVGEYHLVRPIKMPLHLSARYLPADMEKQKAFIRAHNQMILDGWSSNGEF